MEQMSPLLKSVFIIVSNESSSASLPLGVGYEVVPCHAVVRRNGVVTAPTAAWLRDRAARRGGVQAARSVLTLCDGTFRPRHCPSRHRAYSHAACHSPPTADVVRVITTGLSNYGQRSLSWNFGTIALISQVTYQETHDFLPITT